MSTPVNSPPQAEQSRRLTRLRDDQVIGGVAGGLGPTCSATSTWEPPAPFHDAPVLQLSAVTILGDVDIHPVPVVTAAA